MTLIACVKVNDGVVLAADSALTLKTDTVLSGGRIDATNLYNNANKVFNLVGDAPVGLLACGNLTIGGVSLSNLVKGFRLEAADAASTAFVDLSTINVLAIATNFQQSLQNAYTNPYNGRQEGEGFNIQMVVAGYDAGAERSKEYIVGLKTEKDAAGALNLVAEGPTQIMYQGTTGIDVGYGVYVNGQPEVAHRLFKGYGSQLNGTIDAIPTIADQAERHNMETVQRALFLELASPSMPIQDAIDLGAFLITCTTEVLRFMVGPQTVGGPIEIAAITKYECFKWVRRKHYYSKEFNPYEGRGSVI